MRERSEPHSIGRMLTTRSEPPHTWSEPPHTLSENPTQLSENPHNCQITHTTVRNPHKRSKPAKTKAVRTRRRAQFQVYVLLSQL